MEIVKIWNDDEGFFGAAGSDSLNVEETQNNYEKELRQEIKKEYPQVVVEFMYEPSNRVVDVVGVDNDPHWFETIEMEENIGEIIARVYDRGNFWVEKK